MATSVRLAVLQAVLKERVELAAITAYLAAGDGQEA